MKLIKQSGLLLLAIFILIFGLVACSASTVNGTTSVTIDETSVRSNVESLLTAYNSGDYDAFTRDFSPQMKTVLTPEVFQNFRTQSQETLGQFKSISELRQSDTANGKSTWIVSAEFEKSTQQFTITFDQNTGKIDSMDLVQVP